MHEFALTVGVDWSEKHLDACVVAPDGRVLGERRFTQDVEGVAALCGWLLELEPDPALIGIAIELKRGAVIAALIERGFIVESLNPKQLDRFRDRFCVSGAKDDRRDAHALADGLRTDARAFRRVEPEHPLIVQIREVVRQHEDLLALEVADCNRLRDQLLRYFPAAVELADGQFAKTWFLDVLAKVPSPQRARRTRPVEIAPILRAHRIRKRTAREVIDLLRRPTLPVTAGAAVAAERHVLMLVERIRIVARQHQQNLADLDSLTQAFAEDLAQGDECEQHAVTILRSLPGVGRLVAGMLLAEAWEPLQRGDYPSLRVLAGVAPVTRRSGRSRSVMMRRACSPTLRRAMVFMARVAATRDPHWKAVHSEIRQRKSHASSGHVHRIVADKMLRVLCAAIRTRTPYDLQRLGAARAA